MRGLPPLRTTLATAAFAVLVAAWPAAQSAGPAAATAGPPATVRSITRLPLPRGDRITIELSREVPYTADRASDPDRLFFDVTNSVVPGTTSSRAQSLTGTWITGVRVGQHSETSMRIVLQLTGAPRYSVFALYSPFRLVIDLERAPETEPAASPRGVASLVADISPRPESAAPAPSVAAPAPVPPVPEAPVPDLALHVPLISDLPASLKGAHPVILAVPAGPATTAHGDYSLSRQLGLGLSRIVIDPGHGGHDPGAQGNGIDEANLVLDVALRLEALLKGQAGIDAP